MNYIITMANNSTKEKKYISKIEVRIRKIIRQYIFSEALAPGCY